MTYVMTNYYIILSNYIVPRLDSVLVRDPSCHKHYEFVDIISMLLFLAGDLELNPGPNDSPLDVSHNIKDLSLCHINVQSLVHKVDLVAVELSCHDIITISETWLDNSIENNDIAIPNFQPPIRLDRNRHGGGVAVYVKNNIPFNERADLYIPNLEAIWIEVNLGNRKVLIGTFYIHPRFDNWNIVELSIEQAIHISSNIILLGDFNENMLDPSKCRNITNIMNTFSLNQLIKFPTRITNYSKTRIDLVLTPDSLNCTKVGTIYPFCSDHHGIHYSTSFLKVKHHTYQRQIWLYDQADYEKYRHNLSNCNWELHDLSIADQVDKLTNNIIKSAETSIPNKLVTIRPSEPSWFHNEIRTAIRHRKRLHRKAKHTDSPNDWANYRTARNHVISLIRESKITHFKKLASSLQQGNLSPKQWWKVTKQFLQSNKTCEIPAPFQNDTQSCTPSEKANVLNTFFCEQSDVDASNATLPPFTPSTTTLSRIHVTNQDVLDVLKLLDVSKACGPDLLSPRLLKEGATVLSQHMSDIFNCSLSKSYFPDKWKAANVIPVYKKGEKTDPSNYRPISLLSCVSKVFEKCVFKHFYNYLNTNSLITSVQSGFTPGDSAVYQLIDLYDQFARALDDGKEVIAIFCDISKAFDRVWHTGLLFKLRRMGWTGPYFPGFRVI